MLATHQHDSWKYLQIMIDLRSPPRQSLLMAAQANLTILTATTDLDALLGTDAFDCYEVTGRYFSENMNRKLANGLISSGHRITAELVGGGEQYLHTFAIECNARHFITELSLGRVAYDLKRAVEIEVDDGVTTLVRYR